MCIVCWFLAADQTYTVVTSRKSKSCTVGTKHGLFCEETNLAEHTTTDGALKILSRIASVSVSCAHIRPANYHQEPFEASSTTTADVVRAFEPSEPPPSIRKESNVARRSATELAAEAGLMRSACQNESSATPLDASEDFPHQC